MEKSEISEKSGPMVDVRQLIIVNPQHVLGLLLLLLIVTVLRMSNLHLELNHHKQISIEP